MHLLYLTVILSGGIFSTATLAWGHIAYKRTFHQSLHHLCDCDDTTTSLLWCFSVSFHRQDLKTVKKGEVSSSVRSGWTRLWVNHEAVKTGKVKENNCWWWENLKPRCVLLTRHVASLKEGTLKTITRKGPKDGCEGPALPGAKRQFKKPWDKQPFSWMRRTG